MSIQKLAKIIELVNVEQGKNNKEIVISSAEFMDDSFDGEKLYKWNVEDLKNEINGSLNKFMDINHSVHPGGSGGSSSSTCSGGPRPIDVTKDPREPSALEQGLGGTLSGGGGGGIGGYIKHVIDATNKIISDDDADKIIKDLLSKGDKGDATF